MHLPLAARSFGRPPALALRSLRQDDRVVRQRAAGQLSQRGRGKEGEKLVGPKDARIDLHIALSWKGNGIAEFS